MDEFSVAEAAAYLGITKEAVHKAVRENRLKALPDTAPVRLAREAVEEFHELKQQALVASLARSGETPVSVAAKLRAGLFRSEVGMPRPAAARLAAMPSYWRMLFNKGELAAACVPDGECRWCRAVEFSAFLGLRPVEYAEARVELFGGQPCERCAPALLKPFMAALAVRVRAGDRRPSAPRPPLSERERVLAREWTAQRAVTAAAKPVRDDGGKALVARRLREVRARQKDAKRRGDQKYALKLAQMAHDLEQDAARIERRRR